MAPERDPPAASRTFHASSRRGNVVALVAIAGLAIVIFFLISALQKHNAVQDCIDSGRRDCIPLPTD